MKLLLATRNAGKLSELLELVQLEGLELLTLEGFPDLAVVEEEGSTFAEIAAYKARGVLASAGLLTLADDSGLEVDALEGAPGIHSARYAGPGASDSDRIRLLLDRLAGVPPERRTARFRCAVALADPSRPGLVALSEGTCEGRILERPLGSGGFGYDPVFHSIELGKTFAEAQPDEKNRVSHRARALRGMEAPLRALLDEHR